MTFAPTALLALRDLWTANGGEFLGIVGDDSHAATGGYHEGRDDLDRVGIGPGSAKPDYSIIHDRDFRGLTNAASAFDFGAIHGSIEELRAFSVWLVGQCQHSAVGSEDVREVIYSPDGAHVWRWSGVDLQLHEGWPNYTGQGDSSHLTHTHVSYFRDSESRDKLALIAPYFSQQEADMVITNYLPGYRLTIRENADIYEGWTAAKRTRTVPAGGSESWNVIGYAGNCIVWWSAGSNRFECVEDNGSDVASLTAPAAPSLPTVDEAAIRADQRTKDRQEAALRLLP